jgi:hypothetical protein
MSPGIPWLCAAVLGPVEVDHRTPLSGDPVAALGAVEMGNAESQLKRVDVGIATRFIKAGLAGNEGYDRAREESRVRAAEKKIKTTQEDTSAAEMFVQRKVGKKRKTVQVEVVEETVDAEMAEIVEDTVEVAEDIAMTESVESESIEEVTMSWSLPEENDDIQLSSSDAEEDPFISDFFQQVDLATKFRQTPKNKLSPATNRNVNGGKLVIKAFECEPEWCGMVEAEEDEEVDSIEIDAPELPFMDNYRPRQQNKKSATETVVVPEESSLSTDSEIAKKEIVLSEAEILALPKLDTPVEGMDVYFKSMFLHPVQFEPVVLWRWGRVVGVKGNNVAIDIQGPDFSKEDGDDSEDDDMEEGEVLNGEEIFPWTSLLDTRCLIP